MAGLSAKQQLFVNAYLIDPNATEAARKAGYEHPNKQGPRLLVNVGIAAAIRAGREKASEAAGVEASRVVEEMAAVAFSDIGDILDFSGEHLRLLPANRISERARRAIASVKVRRVIEKTADGFQDVELIEFRLWDKNSAVDKLARTKGMYDDSLTLSGGLTVQLDWKDIAAGRTLPDPVESRIAAERNGSHP